GHGSSRGTVAVPGHSLNPARRLDLRANPPDNHPMSVVPLRPDTPEPVPPTDADGWALLDALRRKLDDQAAQGRRTHDQVQQLAESIAALVQLQRKRSRWLNLNSFVAYVLFTILCGAVAFAMYARRAGELGGERDKALADRDAKQAQLDDATAKLAAREHDLEKAVEAKKQPPPPP